MLKKIISGGQTGADRAALDVALLLGMPHGGWIPKGRLTEEGPLPEKYDLRETAGTQYAERTEKNVLEADGTLIFSHGRLTGGSAYTQEKAKFHQRPWLHIDLIKVPGFKAVTEIRQWIQAHTISILNVAGSRASHDPHIYDRVKKILQSVCYLDAVQGEVPIKPPRINDAEDRVSEVSPKTVEEAVELLTARMSLKEKIQIANLSQKELPPLSVLLGDFIINQYGLWGDNHALIAACSFKIQKIRISAEEASLVIIESLWRQLQDSYKMRIVK
jgi:hypothetical protein